MRKHTPSIPAILLLLFALCGQRLNGQETFKEVGESAGLGVTFSRGMSMVDYNADGLDDIFITRKNRNNQLFRNNGDGSFTDVAAEAGLNFVGTSNQSIWADYDNDGDMDCYLTIDDAPNQLYQNQGNNSFTEVGSAAGVAVNTQSSAAIWGDVNGDDLLDLFVFQLMEDNHYFLNNGDGTFRDYTAETGIGMTRLSMGASFIDFDKDRDLDLFITHDGGAGNFLYENNGEGRFTDVSTSTSIYSESEAMGVSIGDFNNDSWPDIYLTNRLGNFLFKNEGGTAFTEIATTAGVDDAGMGWGVSWLDYDNDGLLDLYIANDSYYSDHPNVLYHNEGDERFAKVDVGTAISSEKASYSTAIADLNRDGKTDLLLANWGNTDRAEVFVNESENDHHWLVLQLKRSDNEPVIGSRVKVTTAGASHSRYLLSGTSWSADDSKALIFGLGTGNTIEEVVVTWPNGEESTFQGLSTNAAYSLHGNGTSNPVSYEVTPLQLTGDIDPGDDIVTSTDHELTLATGLSVFPNPFVNQLNLQLQLSAPGQVSVSLLSNHGQALQFLHSEKLGSGRHEMVLPIVPLPPGLYLLQIQVGDETTYRKVIRAN